MYVCSVTCFRDAKTDLPCVLGLDISYVRRNPAVSCVNGYNYVQVQVCECVVYVWKERESERER